MPSLNRILLLGTLTRPPTFRQTAHSTPICTFDLQVDAGHQEKVCVIRVVVFGKQAEPAARHLGDGSTVFVAGRLRQQARVTHEGQKVRSLEVVCERIKFLSAPAGHVRQIARTFIDPPAMLPHADTPATVDESDPPSPDEQAGSQPVHSGSHRRASWRG
jgi:single stranded DNA-binding protein